MNNESRCRKRKRLMKNATSEGRSGTRDGERTTIPRFAQTRHLRRYRGLMDPTQNAAYPGWKRCLP